MANTSLFQSWVGGMLRKPDTLNQESAPAFAFSPKHTLAQYAVTGCLNRTFYASDAAQLETILGLCGGVDEAFIARAAIYAREVGGMKDLPALLCAVLATREGDELSKVFHRVIDNARMLRSFVQILRSGQVGRKSLGTRPKRLIRDWLAARSDESIFAASVGNSPSIVDIVKMVHPKPASTSREALYGYLLDRPYDVDALPMLVREFEAFKEDRTLAIPDVPFQMLTALDLNRRHWNEIARRARWQMTRMNLNTFARHGVFMDAELVEVVAARLRDRESIRKSRAMPYQLMAAYTKTSEKVPSRIRVALQDAMELAIENVPSIDARVVVCPDVSGSMNNPVTGYRRGGTTSVRCVDVAALMAAAIVRKNPDAQVVPFEHRVVNVEVNGRDSVMTNARRLAAVGGGGTNCSAPLIELNRARRSADLVIFVSDNQSWVDARHGPGTSMLREWDRFKRRNRNARLVCLDIQPYGNTQAHDREDILNVGGFSDGVFDAVARFAANGHASGSWVDTIEEIEF